MRDSAPSNPASPGRRRALRHGLALGAGAWQGGAWAASKARVKPVPGQPNGSPAVLPAALRGRLAGCGLPLESFGLYAAPIDAGPAVLALHADQPYVLASTAKLVTTMAALDLLGPRYRWRTRAYLLGELQAGRLDGDLLIVGGGDVRLRSEDLRAWFTQMRGEGLSEVRGNILLDRAAFHLRENDHIGTPPPAPDRPHHFRPDALLLDGGLMRVAARPSSGAQVVAEAWRQVGGLLQGRVLERVSASDGTASSWPLDAEGRLLPVFSAHGSQPLVELVHAMNKVSDNVAARHLMLSLSPGFPRFPATLPAAQDRLQRWLQGQGLARGDIVIDNGSGLSRAERGKPSALVALLRKAWSHPNAQDFIGSLPVAGVDGTLAHRLTQRVVQGQAMLKTGTLLDARALAGYVHGQSGRWYAVAALANHPNAAQATPVLDGVIEWLAKL